MEIKCLRVGELQTNCYLIWDEDTRECFIIDPGDDADFITTEILQLKLNPLGILLTHGHYDHCLACLELKLNFNLPIYLNPKDNFLYQNSDKSANHWSASKALKQPLPSPLPSEITLGDKTLIVSSIPGHTPGSVCFYSAPHLFVGDTIFADGVGRTDFSYSSASDLKKSLAKILSYPDNTLLYPGHEDSPVELSTLQNPD
jgi:glyoxylase-like metal-dependent hydrolase (beta-lactamase superfamily II)